MLGSKWAKELSEQKDFISLGFHPDEFFFDAKLREEKRREMGFSYQDRVVVTATRIRPEKNLEQAIPAFENSHDAKWLLIGSAEDDYANQLRKELDDRIGSDRFTMLPHADREKLNGFYNAADLALYTTPAISIIEAMGSGLPVILPNENSLSHLIDDPHQGQFVSDFQSLPFFDSSREARQRMNLHKLSWQVQAKQLLI